MMNEAPSPAGDASAGILRFQVNANDQHLRVDRFLAERCEDLSRNMVQQAIRDGDVTVDGQKVPPRYRLKSGQIVCMTRRLKTGVKEEQPSLPAAPEIALNICFRDEHFLVNNKQPGLVVHPAAGHRDKTLVNALLAHVPHLRGSFSNEDEDTLWRAGIVHRLDKDTSGLIVVALNPTVQYKLSRLFALRQVRKAYLAAVYPALPRDHMRVEAPIGRHPVNRKKMSTSTRAGRPAVSHFFELCRGQSASLVLARILTGRTHQIRVHLHDECNAGVIGDQVYRCRSPHTSVSRQLLHAWYLAFPHPETGEEIEITAPVPEDFSRFMHETQLTLDQARALRLARKTLT